MVQNKTLTYLAHPTEKIVPGEHIGIKNSDFDPEQAPPAGGITIKIHYVSFDPYQRGRMRPAHIKSYTPAFELNSAITNGGIADVAVVWAQTDDKIRGFVVPTDTPGFTATEVTKKMSLRASVTAELSLVDVRLPASIAAELSEFRVTGEDA